MKTLSLLLFLLLTVAALAQSSGGASSPRANVTWTLSFVGGVWKVAGTVTVSDSGSRYGVAILDPVTGDGGTKNGDRVASYDGSIAAGSFPYEYSLTPGHWYRWIANDSEGPGQNYDQDTTFFLIPSEAPNDCKASVDVTNPYGVPTWFRVVHSIDGELGRVLLQPGQNWTTSWEVTCGGNFVLAYQPTGEETDDVWFVPENPEDPGEPSEDPADWSPTGPPTNDQPPENPAPKPPAPPPPAEAGVPAPKKDKGWLPPWKPREDNEDMSNLLDRDTYREGVENIIGSLSDEGPVTVAEDENPTPTEERVVDAKETVVSFGAALITLREEVTDSLPGVTGSVSTSSTLSATLPSITLLGMTWPSQTWTYDFSDHSGAIGALRSLLIGVLGITYYFAFVRALRGSVPSMSRDAASALPESKVDPMTGRHLWDK